MKPAALVALLALTLPFGSIRAQPRADVRVEIRIPAPPVVVVQEPPPPHPPPPPPPPPRRSPPPPPPAPPPPMPPPRGHGEVLRVKEIKAGHVRARVIYAKEVKARGGHVGRVVRGRDDAPWERGRGDGEIVAPEVFADVIYAKEIKADWIEADEIHAKEVKIGR